MDETSRPSDKLYRQRLAFLEIADADARNLRRLRPIFLRHAEEFAARFYDHLLAHPPTAALLKDERRLEQLKELQSSYFAELLAGAWDEAYVESRLRVGRTHQRVGLEPIWYLGAYNQYIQIAFPFFARAFGDRLADVLPALLSLVKVIFFDIGLALETYFQEATEQLRLRNRELQRALDLYWRAQRGEEQLRKLSSHEIRGGLAAVITGLEDFLDVHRPSLDAASTGQLERVEKRCWALSNLLKEMLATDSAVGPGWVETAPIFESLVSRFAIYVQGKARQIRLHLPKDPPRIWGNPMQLREVFANLVSNAVRFMDKDPGLIEITCRPDGAYYVFCVSDNGPGVPESIRTRLFEPFVHGPPAPGQMEGTGLGLYFVRTIIEQEGGRVWVESEPGRGSRFWFTVPRVPPEPTAAAPAG